MHLGQPLSIGIGAASDRQRAFYEALFGWQFEQGGMVTLDGSDVAVWGLPGDTAGWLTILRSDDVPAAVAAVVDAGGAIVAPVAPSTPVGKFAVVDDPDGARLGIADAAGPPLRPAPGHFVWTQLNAHDLERTAAHYGGLCGWSAQDAANGTFTYRDFLDGGRPVSGLMAIDEASGTGVPVMWQPYVFAPDVEATARVAAESGGKVWVPPTRIQPGTFAVLADPDGVVLAVEDIGD